MENADANEENAKQPVIEEEEQVEEDVLPQENQIVYGEMGGFPAMFVCGERKIEKVNRAIHQFDDNEQDLHHATVLKIMAEAIASISNAYTGDPDLKPSLLAGMEREARARLNMIRRVRLNQTRREDF